LLQNNEVVLKSISILDGWKATKIGKIAFHCPLWSISTMSFLANIRLL